MARYKVEFKHLKQEIGTLKQKPITLAVHTLWQNVTIGDEPLG